MLTEFVQRHQTKLVNTVHFGAKKRRNWLTGCLLFSLTILLFFTLHTNAQLTVPYQTYLARISRYRGQIKNPVSCDIFSQIADELEAISAVEMPDGTIMPVQHDGADQALRRSCHVATADRYLAGLCPSNLCTPGQARPPDPVQAPPEDSLANFPQSMENDSEANPNTGAPLPAGNVPAPALGSEAADAASGAEGGNNPLPGGGDPSPEQATGENPTNPDAGEGGNSTDAAGDGDSATDGSGESGDGAGTDDGASTGDTAVDGNTPTDENGSVDESGASETTGDAGDLSDAGADGANESPSETGATAANESNPETAPDTAVPPEPTTPETTIKPPIPTRTLLIIGIVALIFLFAIIIVLIVRSPEEGLAPTKKQQRTKPSPAVKKELDEGRQNIKQGNYRQAVRKLFLAALITLDEQGALRFDATLTNGELLNHALLRPSLIDPLAPIISTYERVWYGFESLPAPEYDALVQQIEQIKSSSIDEQVNETNDVQKVEGSEAH